MAARVVIVPVFQDNYAYLLVDVAAKIAAAVDPAEPDKVMEAAKREGLTLSAIMTTHHHMDHSGGNVELKEAASLTRVIGGDDRIPGLSELVKDGDEVTIGNLRIKCFATPCHTKGSISYYLAEGGDSPIIFTGDTLFTAGCGRFFEGTAAQMLHNMRNVYAPLPQHTRVYSGHEYTVSNLAFAASVEPDNEDVKKRLTRSQELRRENKPTVPSTIAEELAINPFMRLGRSGAIRAATGADDDEAIMQALREMKNAFKATL